jgi:DNA (cytosine-5)-methyltransferase 1
VTCPPSDRSSAEPGSSTSDCTSPASSHAWLCESDPWRRDLLRARFSGVPVYDDIRTLRGQAGRDAPGRDAVTARANTAASVDLIAGGFPCKGASSAGKRNGFEHPETALWFEMRRVIRELRPRYVLIENVGDIRGMAAAAGEPAGSLWGTVLGDLATLGFGDIRWDCVPAGAVGAPHLRDRIFCVAAQSPRTHEERHTGNERLTNRRADAAGDRDRTAVAVEWGAYAPAIHRWEAIHGTAPEPLVRRMDDGDPGVRRMRARVDRSRLSSLGDGVHVYCAWVVGRAVRELMRTGEWT